MQIARGNFQRVFLLAIVSGATVLNGLHTPAAFSKPTFVIGADKIANHNAPSAHDLAMKNVKDVVHRLRTATLDLINDVEQREMVVTGTPDIMMPIAYDDQKPIGWARQMLELGPALPPRKKWLDVDMSHVGELVKLLQSDINDLASVEGYDQLNSVMQDINNHYQTLTDLTKGPKYDNLAIGKAAVAIYDDLSRLNKPWKNMLNSKTANQ